MSTDLPLTLTMGPLPPNMAWTPQELADAIADRLTISTQQALSLFVSGSVEPTSNVGPWLKDGITWYVWDDNSGSYIPQVLPAASLRYIIGETAPDPADYDFWIQTTALLEPQAVKTYYNSTWTDVYASSLGSYMTVADFNTAIAAYSTTTAMNAAIAAALVPYSTTTQMNAAIAAATFLPYPGQGTSIGLQPITANGTPVEVVMDSAPVNPSPGPINIGSSRYIAPAAGIYVVAVTSQFDNTSADASGVEASISLYKNGSTTGMGDLDGTPSPNGSRWSPSFTVMISLAQNDFLQLYATIADGVGAGQVSLTTFRFSVWRMSP